MSDQTLLKWLEAFREGDVNAVEKLWDRLFPWLVETARKKLPNSIQRINDEEDIALSVFNRMCANVDRTAFHSVEDDDELWRLLVRMTTNRIIDIQRSQSSQKRGGGLVRGQSLFEVSAGVNHPGLDGIDPEQRTPDFELMLAEEHDRLLQALPDDRFRQIAIWRLEGYSQKEIASQLNVSVRSIERKIAIIKDLWSSNSK